MHRSEVVQVTQAYLKGIAYEGHVYVDIEDLLLGIRILSLTSSPHDAQYKISKLVEELRDKLTTVKEEIPKADYNQEKSLME